MTLTANAPITSYVAPAGTVIGHVHLKVADTPRAYAFYTEVLGFRRVDMTPDGFRGAAFLQAPGSTNDHDLGLFQLGPAAGPSGAGRTTVGLYHLAWEVDTLDELERVAGRLLAADALVGTSDHGTTKSLYGRDAGPYDRAIDMQIGRLRRKIEAEPERPALIKSVRGAGYLFVPAVEHGS